MTNRSIHTKVTQTYILLLFAKNVKNLRKERGLTQEALAEMSDFHPTYISNIEQGKRNLSLQAAYQIANALGVTVADLLTEKQ